MQNVQNERKMIGILIDSGFIELVDAEFPFRIDRRKPHPGAKFDQLVALLRKTIDTEFSGEFDFICPCLLMQLTSFHDAFKAAYKDRVIDLGSMHRVKGKRVLFVDQSTHRNALVENSPMELVRRAGGIPVGAVVIIDQSHPEIEQDAGQSHQYKDIPISCIVHSRNVLAFIKRWSPMLDGVLEVA